jgi:hypothetical protein
MLHKVKHDPADLALAQMLRRHAEELSKALPTMSDFWSLRCTKLIETKLAWAEQLEAER